MPDLDYLKRLLGDEALVARFLDLFRQEMPRQLNALQQYLSDGDWESAGATAHAIKGQLRYLGEEEAAGLAYRLEQMAEGTGETATPGAAGSITAALEEAVAGILKKLPA